MRLSLKLAMAITLGILLAPERADAQIEALVMPGKVIEGHADVETDCDACHQKFQRARQRALCLECHEDIAADIGEGAGYHGRFEAASGGKCADCHTDHEGRDADIVHLDEAAFDHDYTDFPLAGEHRNRECTDCHEPASKHRDAPSECLACHEADNVHGDTMGTACGDCHAPAGWAEVEFDHDATGYPLIGRHREAACLDCHADQTFRSAPTECYDCHSADDAHDGRSGTECGNCHSPSGWDDTRFDHARDTDFPLQGRHGELTCSDCHSEDPFGDELEPDCVGCHLEDDNHDGHFGEQCDTCHVESAWTDVVFDHDVDTAHPLNGAHEDAACEACHVEPVFDVALAGDCLDCHREDDAHDGTQGIRCDDCHNEITWQDDVFFDHDLTRFPLLGSHAGVDCESCHETHVFTDAPTNCVDCHADDDPHGHRYEDECATCHNPVDWQQWRFDHDARTEFPLTGAHETVACSTCHRQSLDSQQRLGGRCADCHLGDDIHDGEFGFDCGRCHSADSFSEVRAIR